MNIAEIKSEIARLKIELKSVGLNPALANSVTRKLDRGDKSGAIEELGYRWSMVDAEDIRR